MGWHVYLLRCAADDSLYCGITNNLPARVAAHNSGGGRGAKYTRSRRPVTLVWSEPSVTKAQALRREYAVKQLTRAAKLRLIQG